MRITRPAFLFAALLGLAGGQEYSAADLADRLEVSIEVTLNPMAGSSPDSCDASATAGPARQTWWIAFARAASDPDTGWAGAEAGLGCGTGSFTPGATGGGTSTRPSYLIAEVSTFAGLLPASLIPERVVVVDVALSLHKLSGFGGQGEPVFLEFEEKRKFYLLDEGEAVVPLLVANALEQEAFGLHELMLKLTVHRVADQPAAAYGGVRVRSSKAGEILLDGGVVEQAATGGEILLDNVPVGLRQVHLRDSAGREVGKPVRVHPNRTSLVDLSIPARSKKHSPYRLESLGKNARGYEEYRRGSDDAVVVRIPAGKFLMGNRKTEGSPLEHEVYVSEFLIDKTGVTWGQYKKHAEAIGIPLPPRDPYWGMHDDHPVVFVTWEEAKRYCEWAGGRLPTEAEREKAARGTDRRKYPWGEREPAPHLGVFRSSWGLRATAPVGTHPAGASPFGLLDMGGNVWEWCSDWWDRDYFQVSPERDPKGPVSGTAHVTKGGSWDSRPSVLSASSRNFGYRGYRELDFGFRCAMNAPPTAADSPQP